MPVPRGRISKSAASLESLKAIETAVVACEACPRLRRHCREVARVKRRAYQSETYWGRPVPGYGDPRARLLLIGLGPPAHGGNPTRPGFPGDSERNRPLRAPRRP